MKEDHELPKGSVKNDIKYLKRYSIYAQATGTDPVSSLTFEIYGYTKADRDESGGTVVASAEKAYELIEEFLDDADMEGRLTEQRTPLDFALQKECLIALRLIGKFWEFSPGPHYIKTKDPHGDERYYYLNPHTRGGRVTGVSFFAKEPLKKPTTNPHVRHGINLYIEFQQTDPNNSSKTLRLPVIVDPDIENKGGNN